MLRGRLLGNARIGRARARTDQIFECCGRECNWLAEQLRVDIPRTQSPPLSRAYVAVRQIEQDPREAEEERSLREVVRRLASQGELRGAFLL
jgi:hypothetical protein